MIKELLDRARAMLRERTRQDPWEAVERPTEQAVRELLCDYADRVQQDTAGGGSTLGWIFRANVPHELYQAAFVAMIEDAWAAGQREGAAAMAERANWTCICRCQAHRKIGCPLCLDVYGCPYHSSVDPAVLRPELLTEPEALAAALWSEMTALDEQVGAMLGHVWGESDGPPEWLRQALITALQHVVVVRAKR